MSVIEVMEATEKLGIRDYMIDIGHADFSQKLSKDQVGALLAKDHPVTLFG